MKLMMTGVNHANLTLDERQYFYFTESDKLSFSLNLLDESILQTVILSTCNRSEVYIIGQDDFELKNLRMHYTTYFQHDHPSIITLEGYEAINHLLEVACGLQSMVIGEDQILHQIKEALQWAMELNYTGKEINYIFQSVIGFAKRMKHTYALSNHPLSVSYIGYLAIMNQLKSTDHIMILGSGEMSKLMLKYLENYPIYLVNRTYEKVAMYLNDRVKYVPFEKRLDYLNEVDVVVSATSSPHYVFHYETCNIQHPVIFLDLAMPRDIDPKLKRNPLVKIIDMDELKVEANIQLKERESIALKVKQECAAETVRIENEMKNMKHDLVIRKMQENYLEIADSTYELLIHKLNLNSHEKYILKKILNTQFLRLMKQPIHYIREHQDEDQFSEILEELLGIREEEE